MNAKEPEHTIEEFSIDRSISQLPSVLKNSKKMTITLMYWYLNQVKKHEVWQSLKRKPQVSIEDVLKLFQVAHSYIRALDYFETLTYHVDVKAYVCAKEKGLVMVAQNLRRLQLLILLFVLCLRVLTSKHWIFSTLELSQ